MLTRFLSFADRFKVVNMYSIYVHTFPNGKTYVGITMKDVNIRWGNGNNYANCSAVNRAIKKYGWENIKHDVVRVAETKEDAERIERLLIYKYGSNDKRFGYNILPGGDARGGLPQESRKRIGEKNKAIWANDEKKRSAAAERMKKRMSDPRYRQKVLTALQKSIIENQCEHLKKRVAQISLDGEVIKIWGCMADIQRDGIATRQAISSCCLGKMKTCKGFIWKFADDV